MFAESEEEEEEISEEISEDVTPIPTPSDDFANIFICQQQIQIVP
jgi:hypothetical protein